MINQAPIVRYMASVCEILFSDFRKKTFSAESVSRPDPKSQIPARIPNRVRLHSGGGPANRGEFRAKQNSELMRNNNGRILLIVEKI
jgi:hypothetical protein